MKCARVVLTDSGGMQKEAFWLETPCITLREKTVWVETVKLGANVLVRNNKWDIIEKTRNYLSGKKRIKNVLSMFGDGRASEKIINIILEEVDG